MLSICISNVKIHQRAFFIYSTKLHGEAPLTTSPQPFSVIDTSQILLQEEKMMHGGVYKPCIYTHAKWELLCTTQIFVVLVWRPLGANDLPCALILGVGRLDKVAGADHSRWPLFTVKWLSLLEMGEEPAGTEEVNMVLNIHKSHKAYWRGGGGEGDYMPITTLSPPEWLLH